jgi:hypothetical protein
VTQISGSVTLDISARNLARAIAAELVAAGLTDAIVDRALDRAAARGLLATPAGSTTYDRPADPDPGAGERTVRFGGVDEAGVHYDTPKEQS